MEMTLKTMIYNDSLPKWGFLLLKNLFAAPHGPRPKYRIEKEFFHKTIAAEGPS
jgi:hypothetical protein